VSSSNTYIEADVSIGVDTLIQPFVFIGRQASIGPDCVIGPFASVPRQAIVPEGSIITGNSSLQTA